jgi:transcriptional regulator with XRE-family HTH domain
MNAVEVRRPAPDVAWEGIISELARVLRQARLDAGLTQRQVADAIGVPHTYPSRWERGTVAPRPESLLALADLFRLDPAMLLRVRVGAPPAASPSAEAVERAVTKAAQPQRRARKRRSA